MWIPQEVLVKFEKLMPGKHLVDMKAMVKQSAPVTHERGNRRFHELVFDIRGTKVKDVDFFESRGCELCDYRGYTIMHDDFMMETVKIPCHCQAPLS